MEVNELTYSEKTLIISLLAKEISHLQNSNASEERITDLEAIILKLERM